LCYHAAVNKRNVYLDHAAATPLRPEVRRAMEPWLATNFANPSSLYQGGVAARKAVEDARAKIAHLIGARPIELTFTGSATEANNLATFGVLGATPGPLVTTPLEHASVAQPARELERRGEEVRYVRVDERGYVDAKDLKEKAAGASLVSIIYASNEIGTVQPLKELAKVARRSGALTHTDACQAAPALPLSPVELGVDLLTLNAAKIGGPKGVGLLYHKAGVELRPLVYGGGQERGLRAGTENVAAIVGFAAALELARSETGETGERLRELGSYLQAKLNTFDVRFNGDLDNGRPGLLSVTFPGIDAEALVLYLDAAGVQVSSGAACDSEKPEASAVLEAIGLPGADARSAIRISLGRQTTREDLDYLLSVLPGVIAKLS
jgi:cysteine desulfurase